jgi:gamma-glutamyl:cysteine ligase YbdK (ATP-grasp superfamily)
MDQKQILKQMIEFNQATFNNTFQAMMLLQDQFERVAQTAIDQSNWLPAEGRKAIENWVEAYKTGRDNYKSYVEDSYKKVEKYFAD